MSVTNPIPQSAVLWSNPHSSATITCLGCGTTFEIVALHPRLRCPHCQTLGYPDRSGQNLLSLDWECAACDAVNDGSLNFCLSCGAGLASRCFRCEQPIYTSVCDHCGTRQGQFVLYQQAEARRETWIPLLQEQIREQRAREELVANRHIDPSYGVAEWRTIDAQWREAVQQRQARISRKRTQKPARSNAGKRPTWGWIWLLAGTAWLIGANYEQVGPVMQRWASTSEITGWISSLVEQAPPWFESGIGWLQSWWFAFAGSLTDPIDPQGLEYALLFASALLGIAILPVLFFLLGKLVKTIFP